MAQLRGGRQHTIGMFGALVALMTVVFAFVLDYQGKEAPALVGIALPVFGMFGAAVGAAGWRNAANARGPRA